MNNTFSHLKGLIVAIIALIVVGGIVAVTGIGNRNNEPASKSVSNAELEEVRAVVTGFGSAMKNVSVLAINRPENNHAILETAYGNYVTDELIAKWYANPNEALGRNTSSPSPDRINISGMVEHGPDYKVEGTVVEVTSDNQVAATYPVSFIVKKINGQWKIAEATKGAYSEIPARTSIIGTGICLPHRDTSGPQTLECAFGIKETSTGKNYAVNTQLMSQMFDFQTGVEMKIDGVMVPIEQLSTNQWQKYDVVGIISATQITILK